MANFEHWGITDGFRLAQTVGKELNNPSNYTPEEFIAAAEQALLKNPNEWVIHYSLADKYQHVGDYSKALNASKKCVKIRPDDIRSAYALATSYNILTRAAWSKEEEEAANMDNSMLGNQDIVDKKLSQAELDQIGLTVETAAIQALRWFEKALTLNPDRQSREGIQLNIQILQKRFPKIEE